MDNYKYNQFSESISTFAKLKHKKEVEARDELSNQFSIHINELKAWKKTVYPLRFEETKSIIEANKHKIQFSTFELMEHNFRENTHSSILRYLFHYKFIDQGSQILSDFMFEITSDENIRNLILKKQYDIKREHPVTKGRIDLFIKDDKNQFVIVIENKIYADIGIKEISEEGEITKTQLTNYQNYVEENCKGYRHYFVLLSYKEVEESSKTGSFIVTDYNGLIEILNKVKSDDNILREYKNLLFCLTKMEYRREYLIDLIADIKNGEDKEMSLSNLELINTYYE